MAFTQKDAIVFKVCYAALCLNIKDLPDRPEERLNYLLSRCCDSEQYNYIEQDDSGELAQRLINAIESIISCRTLEM